MDEKKMMLCGKARDMADYFAEMAIRLENDDEVDFGEIEKSLFTFLFEINRIRLESFWNDLSSNPDQAFRNVVSFFNGKSSRGMSDDKISYFCRRFREKLKSRQWDENGIRTVVDVFEQIVEEQKV
jgi:hypothetical protein